MNASKVSLELIKGWEKCKLKAYKCQAGVWTLGYGQTGKDIVEGSTCTQEEAEAWVVATVKAHAEGVTKGLKRAATQAQFDAMVSLSYNIGKTAFANSTVLRQHNAGNFRDASAAFMMWNKITIDGFLTYSEGLNNRRLSEKALYLTVSLPKAA